MGCGLFVVSFSLNFSMGCGLFVISFFLIFSMGCGLFVVSFFHAPYQFSFFISLQFSNNFFPNKSGRFFFCKSSKKMLPELIQYISENKIQNNILLENLMGYSQKIAFFLLTLKRTLLAQKNLKVLFIGPASSMNNNDCYWFKNYVYQLKLLFTNNKDVIISKRN